MEAATSTITCSMDSSALLAQLHPAHQPQRNGCICLYPLTRPPALLFRP